jgi:16S rRNA (uracil1498-N3)-methyltransferase
VTAPTFVVDEGVLQPGTRTVVIAGPEGHHAARVRRVELGELIHVIDGRGTVAAATVVRVDRDQIECAVDALRVEERPAPRLTVVQALPKGDRGELAVELMTEVGVDVVVPWVATRCVTRWRDERGARALGRWRTAAREAAKQSRRGWVPEVTELATTTDVAARLAGSRQGIVLHEGGEQRLTDLAVPTDGDVVVVVGPEGGLTDEELATFSAAGASIRRLGPTVLRTSTAGVVAAGILLAASPRW